MAPYPIAGLWCPHNFRPLRTREPSMSPLFQEPINFKLEPTSSTTPSLHRFSSPSPSLRRPQPPHRSPPASLCSPPAPSGSSPSPRDAERPIRFSTNLFDHTRSASSTVTTL